ncbi:unnamed protein product [Mytilus coruscus]|uniref:C2H2-type domain-containing protein n=1 Tax=Mytilus coruscus TaxID=42192 RepID=A0A6J8E892_MYTCO|nr:unnamed protein product [Mytilus coruscus]
MDPSADRFLEWLLEKYPESDERMTSELQTLKRKLKEFNESDDDDLVQELERVENKKPKFEYSCDICGQQFRQKYNKNQHMKSHFATFLCGKCGKSFSRDNTRKAHEKKYMKHSASNYNTKKNDDEQGNDQNSTKIKVNKFARYVRKGAINDNVNQTIIFPEREEKYDIFGVFAETKIEVQHELKVRREKIRDIKWYLNVRVEMERNIDDGRKEKVTPHFRSKAYTSLENDDNEHNLNDAFQKMNASLEEFIHKGSNWVVKKIIGVPIKEFIGLRPKMYSLVYDVGGGCREKRTAKGIAKCAVEKQICHLHYKQCLFRNRMTLNDMNLIRSDNHILFINKVRKTGLCNFDDKRFWKNLVQSYAYGHYKIPFVQKCCNVYC